MSQTTGDQQQHQNQTAASEQHSSDNVSSGALKPRNSATGCKNSSGSCPQRNIMYGTHRLRRRPRQRHFTGFLTFLALYFFARRKERETSGEGVKSHISSVSVATAPIRAEPIDVVTVSLESCWDPPNKTAPAAAAVDPGCKRREQSKTTNKRQTRHTRTQSGMRQPPSVLTERSQGTAEWPREGHPPGIWPPSASRPRLPWSTSAAPA